MNKDASTFELDPAECHVEHISTHNSDKMVVDAARVSYGSESASDAPLTDKDIRLVNYLALHKHYSPFRHLSLTLRITAPEFVMRQLYKHVVGISATSAYPTVDHAWGEVSMRYRKMGSFYIPRVWNTQHVVSKQCSGDPLDTETQHILTEKYSRFIGETWALYDEFIRLGVSKEQARLMLPLSTCTQVVWTASLQAIHNFVVLRKDPHAQYEIRVLADQIEQIAQREFPVAYAALSQNPGQV